MTEIAEINKLVGDLSEVRKSIDVVNASLKCLNETKEAIQSRLLDILDENKLTSFKGEAGMVTRSSRFDVKFPRGDNEAKTAFRKYLEDKGEFDDKWEMNYMSLNAWYKAELEAASQREEADFEIPGLEPSARVTLKFTGAK